jgi:hypothetical protein
MAALSPEERRNRAIRANATLTPEQRSARARKRDENMGPEKRSQRALKGLAHFTKEELSERAKRRQAAIPPEIRSQRSSKAATTRKKNGTWKSGPKRRGLHFVCLSCKKEFYVVQSEASYRKYCSKSCSGKVHRLRTSQTESKE